MEKSFLELAQRIDSVLTKHACKHAAMVTGAGKDMHEILIQLIDLADNGVLALDAIVTLRKVSLRLLPSRARISPKFWRVMAKHALPRRYIKRRSRKSLKRKPAVYARHFLPS